MPCTKNLLINSYTTRKDLVHKQLHHILSRPALNFQGRKWWGMGGWFKLSMNFIYFRTLNTQDISICVLYDFSFCYKSMYFLGLKAAWMTFFHHSYPTPLSSVITLITSVWAYSLIFSCRWPLLGVSNHFVLNQGWSRMRELTVPIIEHKSQCS